ncbi:hypothetical protein PILCRDRAFT_1386 [Piloderma croceum F 1598]|uniref:MutL C-terminal dimerisation domain-containing protein n=1 Tax=Piloderma croceum (strain F 1598) TaxID=765440 RepID=A0A0C3G4N3_PILCF|nr:hypothetical protein PILCRDRAFT_1386 [Piloderma croceum F 1598]
MATRASIEHLPTATCNKLRSTQILTSLPQVISELLQNSLDAGAHQVDIGVDCEEWSCWVRDNGVGMSKEGMTVLGEGRYGTSKAYDPVSLNNVSTFGFRGEALASIADLCCLEISSRTARSRESWSLIIKDGKNLYNGPSIRWRREQAGTVICIRDAFYNLPIRRRSHPTPARTLELIRQDIESFALIFPDVSFSLENTNGAHEGSSSKTHITRIPKTTSTATAFRHIYGRALAEHIDEIKETFEDMKLEGFISLNGAHSKSYQFLYINRHPLAPCDIHRIIDNKFTSSTFTKHAYDETGETALPRSTTRRSPRKTERKAVYVLNLTIPPQNIDNCLEPAKATVQFQNRNIVSSFVSSVIQSFLTRHGFASQQAAEGKSPTKGGSPSPHKRRRITPDVSNIISSEPDQARFPKDAVILPPPQPLYISPDETDEDTIIWKDPNTGESFVVDTRTGNSYPQEAPMLEKNEHGVKRRTLQSSDLLKKSKDPCSIEDVAEDDRAMPNWLQQALQANKAYPLTESKIPSLSLASTFTNEMQDCSRQNPHACHSKHQSTSRYFQAGHIDAESTLPSRRFRKEDLLNAQVLDQVDRKFIACLIHADTDTIGDTDASGRALVLIDQHAADERIRVERFLKELCLGFLQHNNRSNGVKTKMLSPSVPVLLTRHEALRLADSDVVRHAFECWGILFDDLSSSSSHSFHGGLDDAGGEGYVQVFVKSIPAVVSEKLLMADELRELIKGFLAKLDEGGLTSSFASAQKTIHEGANEEPFFWLKALRWCPRELLDLVNSKACRGAIMFNDSLTKSQCQQLIRKLSETAFPFQCAHGRPSLVPLANVDDQKAANGRYRATRVEWDRL